MDKRAVDENCQSMKKLVMGKCERTGKKQFATYQDAVKFTKKLEHSKKILRKNIGSEAFKNVDKLVCVNWGFDKKPKAIYRCKYCGLYHFSSQQLQYEHKKSNKSIDSKFKTK